LPPGPQERVKGVPQGVPFPISSLLWESPLCAQSNFNVDLQVFFFHGGLRMLPGERFQSIYFAGLFSPFTLVVFCFFFLGLCSAARSAVPLGTNAPSSDSLLLKPLRGPECFFCRFPSELLLAPVPRPPGSSHVFCYTLFPRRRFFLNSALTGFSFFCVRPLTAAP